jgi:protein O-GlcNAc transferase
MNKPNNTTEKLLALSHHQFKLNQLSQARETLNQLNKINPLSPPAWSNLAYLCYLQGNMDEAIKHSRHAITLDATYAPAHSHLGIALLAKQQLNEALQVLEDASQWAPDAADLWCNLGLAYQQNQQVSLAIDTLKKAISLNPTLIDAQCNIASCYQDFAQVEQAATAYQQALLIDPQHRAVISNYLLCLQYHPEKSSKELLSAAINTTAPLNQLSTQPTHTTKASIDISRKIRLGFVSADFNSHPIGWFFSGVFTALSQKNCDCYCYFDHHKEDTISDTFKHAASGWRVIHGKSDNAVVDMINADGIDVLVDLSGHTAGNRLAVFARRAASIQLSWLGYPGTSAIEAMDAVILGQDMITAATAHFFTEAIIPLNCPQFVYTPPDYLPAIATPAFQNNGFTTFGCFNNVAKLNDTVLQTWAKILHRVKDSQLILKWKSFADNAVCDYFLRRFHTLGIPSHRIELRAQSSHQQMLEQYADIDIALDPFPFSGALTSYEATWMGVPVITLFTDRPISRQTYAMNKALGLSELSSQTPAEYVDAACQLAANKCRLLKLRNDLRLTAQRSPLYDVGACAEQLYKCFCLTAREGVSSVSKISSGAKNEKPVLDLRS